MILKFHHAQITIPKGQEEKARKFYCGVLLLKEIQKPESLLDRGGFWVEVGDQQLHIGTEAGVDRLLTKASSRLRSRRYQANGNPAKRKWN